MAKGLENPPVNLYDNLQPNLISDGAKTAALRKGMEGIPLLDRQGLDSTFAHLKREGAMPVGWGEFVRLFGEPGADDESAVQRGFRLVEKLDPNVAGEILDISQPASNLNFPSTSNKNLPDGSGEAA